MSIVSMLCLGFTSATAVADASTGSDGGVGFPSEPTLENGTCVSGERWRCQRGETLTLTGDGLAGVTSVRFLGRSGRGDDRAAQPLRATEHKLTVAVPVDAVGGPLRVHDGRHTVKAPRTLQIFQGEPVAGTNDATEAATAASMGSEGVFPIRGKHDMGQSPDNAFGGARKHGGQDLFARCGTPLVAVRSGTVQIAKFQDRAGNYVVLQAADGQSYAYMHLQAPSPLQQGDAVVAGEPVGKVGDTGRATGCHLHFEQWTAPGWYTGGHAIDPLPQLRRWEAAPHSHG